MTITRPSTAAPAAKGRAEVPRDRWKRPLIKVAGATKPVPYTRCTTYVDCIEDKSGLAKWERRMVLLGAAHLPHLLPNAGAVDLSRREDRDSLNALADQFVEAAGAHAKQRKGTRLHHLSEHVDRGEQLPACTAADLADMGAYKVATVALDFTTIEQLVVVDALKVAGTPDRIAHYSGPGPTGEAIEGNIIADLKTGSVEYGVLKMAMQLSVYAHGEFYDPATGERSPLPEVRRDWGLIIHLPAGTGQCAVYWIDLALGWEAVQVATQVRAIRARRTRLKPLADPAASVGSALVDP